MSSIRSALEKLDRAVDQLDVSVRSAEGALQQQVSQPLADGENVIDVDFVALRLDRAIASVEKLLGAEK